jgi:hypothetical protein
MNRIVYLTTDTDGLVKHTRVCEETLKYFPNLLRLSYVDGDNRVEVLVKQKGVKVPEYITKINGIDNLMINELGLHPAVIANYIVDLFESEPIIVTNGLKFHRLTLEAFMFRLGLKLPDATWIDIQEIYKPICKLPCSKPGDYKTPKLSELDDFLTDSGVPVAGQTQIDIIETAYKNLEVLRERAKKEDEHSCY